MPRSSSDTRERILAVAMELFIQQGYEATSLRQIADRLGVTKAALYYHFQSKDELLLAILQPANQLLDDLLDRLESARSVEAWADAMVWVIDAMFQFVDFFKLMITNRAVVHQVMDGTGLIEDHEQMHERVMRAVMVASDDLGERVRMVAALGAVTGFDDWAPTLLTETPTEDLRRELVAAVRATLGVDASLPA
jgi:AcrR family transcriptional regulator